MEKVQKNESKKGGYVITAELILVTTIMVIGLITGMVKVRNAVVYELADVSEAIGQLDQSYEYTGMDINNENQAISTAGGAFVDGVDHATGDQGNGGTDGLDINTTDGDEDEENNPDVN